MYKIYVLLIIFVSFNCYAQEDNTIKTYRKTETTIHDLIHTKLKVDFDFKKRQMHGEAWITAKSHFYPKQNLVLDAKAMQIHNVSNNDNKLDYNYDGSKLIIDLGRVYTKDEKFTVYIKYTAQPEEVKQIGSRAISDAKGLYFIDPDDIDPEKPTQIWTQGETESSSCWFPTIDTPNQKTTEEIFITIPEKFSTLSNGLLYSQIDNEDGTRTDHWKMKQAHAPYLFFMGIGEYSIIKDHWKGIEVNYYVEPEYQDVAKEIFGNTPEMIQFFSNRFGVSYPWEKYSQIVAHDFVSGAMENTTATLHNESAYQKKGQLIDENKWEDVISHELSHHWFGDLVTTESWSNITLNESFATYATYLWREYKYGKDHANALLYQYKSSYASNKDLYDRDLVRFHYSSREDVFDGVSYQKGANILHMLRKQLGDEAFFSGLQMYLQKNQYKSAETHQLRIALEEVSGKDLNPFFNQWYYKNGHPILHISYEYNDLLNQVTVVIKQAEQIFSFPLSIDVYESGTVANHQVQVTQREQSFTFNYSKRPNLVNINADHSLLCEINDDFKTLDNYIFQYNHASHYMDRREAILYLSKHQDNEASFKSLTKALNDSYHGLRILALESINLTYKFKKKSTIKTIENIATSDPKTKVRAVAIKVLGKLVDPVYKPVFKRGMNSQSYAVKGNATLALFEIDKQETLSIIKTFDKDTKKDLATILTRIYIIENDESEMPYIAKNLLSTMFSSNFSRYQKEAFDKTFNWIASSNNTFAIKNLVSDLVDKGKRFKKQGVNQLSLSLLRKILELQDQTKNENKIDISILTKKGIAQLID
jgi:aminopeptidase N